MSADQTTGLWHVRFYDGRNCKVIAGCDEEEALKNARKRWGKRLGREQVSRVVPKTRWSEAAA